MSEHAENNRSYSLSQYLSSVQRLVKKQIPSVWIYGVISRVTERGNAVYIDLAEYDEGSVLPKASLNLVVFAAQYATLCRRLSSLPTPFQLKKDLKIKVLAEADFYIPQGKFQAKIADIDENWTLGEIALTRAKIWDKLVKEGLHRLNGALPMPLLPLRVGLITAENSAAYNDFISVLRESGYAFEVIPVWAKMQGANTESDILTALGKLREMNESDFLDVVCIVRGGGAKTDLVFFDSEAMCRAVAEFPLPVLTGIGHEIDQCLLDKVAHTHCITPTECAKFLAERVSEAEERLKILSMELQGLMQVFVREGDKLTYKVSSLKNACNRYWVKHIETLNRDSQGLKLGAQKILDYQKLQMQLLDEKTRFANPEIQLKRGYTITRNEKGKVVKSAEDAMKNDILKTQFADGIITVKTQF
ncbi:exodeoxyribonuclease 7 large subunit [Fibrobacterales bacterium]|nr:exodeoxyribonuclease 7 large subunit [Fibrobacterales bacterium]